MLGSWKTKGFTFLCLFLAIIASFHSNAQTAGQTRYTGGELFFGNGTAWVSLDRGTTGVACSSSREGAIRYNGTTSRPEYCNGSQWRLMSGTLFVGGAGAAGNMRYSSAEVQVHNGTGWLRTSSCIGGYPNPSGGCFYLGAVAQSCNTVCSNNNQGSTCDLDATQSVSTSNVACQDILTGLGRTPGTVGVSTYAYGCSISAGDIVRRHTTSTSVTCAASNASYARACGCFLPAVLPGFLQAGTLGRGGPVTTRVSGFSSLPTQGNLVAVYVWSRLAGTTSFSIPASNITDNNGNTYEAGCSNIGLGTASVSAYLGAQIFYAKNISVNQGSFIVTAAAPSAMELAVRVVEFQGLSRTAPLDQVVSNSGNLYIQDMGTSGTLATNRQVGAAMFTTNPTIGGVFNHPTGYTSLSVMTCCAAGPHGAGSYRSISSSAPQSGTWDHDGADLSYRTCLATFK